MRLIPRKSGDIRKTRSISEPLFNVKRQETRKAGHRLTQINTDMIQNQMKYFWQKALLSEACLILLLFFI